MSPMRRSRQAPAFSDDWKLLHALYSVSVCNVLEKAPWAAQAYLITLLFFVGQLLR